jgi:hypothetical protein
MQETVPGQKEKLEQSVFLYIAATLDAHQSF